MKKQIHVYIHNMPTKDAEPRASYKGYDILKSDGKFYVHPTGGKKSLGYQGFASIVEAKSHIDKAQTKDAEKCYDFDVYKPYAEFQPGMNKYRAGIEKNGKSVWTSRELYPTEEAAKAAANKQIEKAGVKDAKTKDTWPSHLDSMIVKFEQRMGHPDNYTSPLMITGTIHEFNSIMYETEKITKSSKSTPEEKQKAYKIAADLGRKYRSKLGEMDKTAAAAFKARKQ